MDFIFNVSGIMQQIKSINKGRDKEEKQQNFRQQGQVTTHFALCSHINDPGCTFWN